jgi:hypothetical protein
MRQRRAVSRTCLPGVGLVLSLLSLAPGCRERSGAGEGPPRRASATPGPVAARRRPALARVPSRAQPPPGEAGDTARAGAAKLLGLWGLEQVRVAGMSVPLPRHFRIRLHFLPGGKLVVHGVSRTKPTRTEGTWRVAGQRLLSTVGGKPEVRTFALDGDRLTLTQVALRRTVWRLKRMPAPRK